METCETALPERLVVYSLPVSGGEFVAQLGLLCELYEALTKTRIYKPFPDLVFGSSGGNIAAYVAMAADWSPDGIMRVARHIEPEMFIKSWFPTGFKFIPSVVAGLFNKSVYNEGYGGEYLYRRYFTNTSIARIEVWTGTYNKDTNKAELFCNKSQSSCMIQNSDFYQTRHMYDTMPLQYLEDTDDRIKRLSEISAASASIPYVVKSKLIGTSKYADGGILGSSPTTQLGFLLYNIVMGHSEQSKADHEELLLSRCGTITVPKVQVLPKKRLCHYYICSYDVDAPYTKSTTTGVSTDIPLTELISKLIQSSILFDRMIGFNLVKALAGKELAKVQIVHFPELDYHKLNKILKWLYSHALHFSCILYPFTQSSITISGFTEKEILKCIATTRQYYGAKICYFPIGDAVLDLHVVDC